MHTTCQEEFFIKNIELKNVRYINNFFIPLSDTERKHLLITGKNGSGKTTTLIEINNLLIALYDNQFSNIEAYKKNIQTLTKSTDLYKEELQKANTEISHFQKELQKHQNNKTNSVIIENTIVNIKNKEISITSYQNNIDTWEKEIKTMQENIDNFSTVDINFHNQSNMYNHVKNGDFIMAYFESKRINKPNVPNNIQKLALNKRIQPNTQDLNNKFIQYIVNLRMEMLDAREEKDIDEVTKIEHWFDRFENSLRKLFDRKELNLKYDRKNFNYIIQYDSKSFGLNELSDGYSAVLSIITELILRMEAHHVNNYDLQGVVLIDEIETHLHVSLQKKVLPFLTEFFPKIQFIVTTHSPFVLSSLDNVVICDLENRLITQELTGYSYESLVDSYFDVDKYSDFIKRKLIKYEELSIKGRDNLNDEEKLELLEMKLFFNKIPPYQNEELHIEIARINRINEKNSK